MMRVQVNLAKQVNQSSLTCQEFRLPKHKHKCKYKYKYKYKCKCKYK